MSARALTPVFQWLAHRKANPPAAGVDTYPAPAAGNHPAEAVFLAISTALLTATAVISLTASIPWTWLRWPVNLVLLFILPHVVMALVSLISARIAGTRWHRGVVQDWCCLATMTLYAAARSTAVGWTAWVCYTWLIFMILNGLLALRGGRSSC